MTNYIAAAVVLVAALIVMDQGIAQFMDLSFRSIGLRLRMEWIRHQLLAGILYTHIFGYLKYKRIAKQLLKELEEDIEQVRP